ncbi:Arc family DNA-binding protein [Nocardioides pantholopis]|uniref:Arc family DNA-binding protein n=1 Tax=Nocardioides pantholopis TaxID=2483798 RepID=UPI001F495E7F|nr:Arc family DNA-binding protein [Nocardioides pantholopis]
MPRGVPGPERKQIPLRLSRPVADAVRRWADDELRSVNAQIEKVLHDALVRAGRLREDESEDGSGPADRPAQ